MPWIKMKSRKPILDGWYQIILRGGETKDAFWIEDAFHVPEESLSIFSTEQTERLENSVIRLWQTAKTSARDKKASRASSATYKEVFNELISALQAITNDSDSYDDVDDWDKGYSACARSLLRRAVEAERICSTPRQKRQKTD